MLGGTGHKDSVRHYVNSSSDVAWVAVQPGGEEDVSEIVLYFCCNLSNLLNLSLDESHFLAPSTLRCGHLTVVFLTYNANERETDQGWWSFYDAWLQFNHRDTNCNVSICSSEIP